MNLEFSFNPFATPIFLTSLLFVVLAFFSFSKNNQHGERYFSFFMLSSFFYSFFYGIELIATTPEGIKLFYMLEFIGGAFVTPFLFLFVLKYTDQAKFISNNWLNLIFGISGFFLLMIFTNDYHHLFYKEISAANNSYFLSVSLERGLLHWMYASYNSILIIFSNLLLFRMLFSIPEIYRGQVLIMLFGTLIPWIAYLFVVFGFYPFGLDPVPFCLAISGVTLFWALFQYQLFRANPIAFKTIFENITDGIVILDRLGEVVALNYAARKFFSKLSPQKIYKKEQLIGLSNDLEELFSANSPNHKIEIVIPEEKEVYEIYLKNIEKDSFEIGTPNFQYLFLRDITEQKSTEELIMANELTLQNVNSNLIRNEKMLTSIAFATKELLSNHDFATATQKAITLLGDGAGVDRAYLFENSLDENGNLLSSQRFEWSALGVPAEIDNPNLQGLPIGLFGEGSRVMAQNKLYQAIVDQMETDPELKELLQSQDIKSILLIPIYVEDYFWGFVGFDDCTNERKWSEAETALLISFADSISNAIERKNMERNLIKSMEAANEASIAKSEFLANMSHEIRTPLNGVIGFSDLLMKTNLDENQRGFLQSILQSGTLLLDLINDILDFSKIEAGKLELSPEWVNIKDLVSDTLKIIQPIASEKNLKLNLNLDENLPKSVFVDSTRIKQVLINLLSNAAKFTHQGHIELGVTIDGQISADGVMPIVFSVEDTGIGISKEKERTIFEAFAQEDNSTTRKYGGTGLGLSICSKLLDLMQSKLELQTSLGKGSKFYFKLDLSVSEETVKPKNEEKMNGSSQPATSKKENISSSAFKILLVDDNPVNMLLAKAIVKKLLPTSIISEAYNGLEALEEYKKQVPDLIFMDIQMPEMSGYEATKEIRKIETDVRTPIVALTAGTVKGEYQRCLEAGMDDYLSKPVLVSDISGMIEKHLGSAPSTSQYIASSKFEEYRLSDPEFFKELLEVSISNIEKLQKALILNLGENNLHVVKQTGHALKGVGLNLDFKELVTTSSAVELLVSLDEENKTVVDKTIQEVHKILESLKSEWESVKD
ncbi:ATP-binding protein [Aquiflexum sp. LQ15W]|uniref:histidine kinase N-terminal 7TM domain-containing protein n=1 Tax=Cognataquiflexum nitidum TaxID=2922272 RepID=UPI001F148087|nr:histidine kinase N-terminal 7TM domain-containing protein [Cognataquiflexum nitidum]MCH6198513.1 ATP-binding protein [Cognataquiflexum nitidum]